MMNLYIVRREQGGEIARRELSDGSIARRKQAELSLAW